MGSRILRARWIFEVQHPSRELVSRLSPGLPKGWSHVPREGRTASFVTAGADGDGALWLVNAEQFGTLRVSVDPDYVTDLARAFTAELAVSPWAEDARVECIGVAGEVRPINPARIRHHDEPTHIVDLVTVAIEHAERLSATDASDTPTARSTDADLDTRPAHLLVITGKDAGLAGPLRTMVMERPGRTGTAVSSSALKLGTTATSISTSPATAGSRSPNSTWCQPASPATKPEGSPDSWSRPTPSPTPSSR